MFGLARVDAFQSTAEASAIERHVAWPQGSQLCVEKAVLQLQVAGFATGRELQSQLQS